MEKVKKGMLVFAAAAMAALPGIPALAASQPEFPEFHVDIKCEYIYHDIPPGEEYPDSDLEEAASPYNVQIGTQDAAPFDTITFNMGTKSITWHDYLDPDTPISGAPEFNNRFALLLMIRRFSYGTMRLVLMQ